MNEIWKPPSFWTYPSWLQRTSTCNVRPELSKKGNLAECIHPTILLDHPKKGKSERPIGDPTASWKSLWKNDGTRGWSDSHPHPHHRPKNPKIAGRIRDEYVHCFPHLAWEFVPSWLMCFHVFSSFSGIQKNANLVMASYKFQGWN